MKRLSFNHFRYFVNLTLFTPIHLKFAYLNRRNLNLGIRICYRTSSHIYVACISLFIGLCTSSLCSLCVMQPSFCMYTAGGKYGCVIGLHSFELAL